MNINISNASGEPIYLQITNQIKSMILDGKLVAGDMLPSMRNLAIELRISFMTTKRAYEELEAEGWAADRIRGRLKGTKLADGPFAEGFITTTMLFCVGTMTVIGSIEAGLNQNYEILIAKSIMDFMSSLIFAAALGAGVLLSAVSVLVIQGGIVLLAGLAAPVLTTEVVTEMTAVGGTLFIGMAINLLGISEKHIKIGDMLPGIFLPILYFPLQAWLSGLF